ncbi:ABC transporter substrate-binding protein [Consotaella aegiceratis]|uniref:ABC transporter substrate-binding protein n=1 Tax=Consotaella aegiceratis TaxID=3097961 RepID=UPI002F416D08
MRLTRRTFNASAAAALLTPFVVRRGWAQDQTGIIRSKVIAPLASLDPIWTTAYITRNHGYMIYDTLFGMDNTLAIQPQMVDSYDVSGDQLTYTFTLRDGLAFHDGSPVTSKDCVASIARWAKKDNLGSRMASQMTKLEPVDDRTFQIVLSQPFSMLLTALAKVGSNVCFIMPERVASKDVSEQITETIGSGPFKFAADEYVAGSKAVYLRNEAYVPRSEPASGTAGGKVVNVDRVEWLFMDDMTATSAMQAGELDFFEEPSPELLPVLSAAGNIDVAVHNTIGMQLVIRPNHTAAPFDNPAFRKAFMRMINPEEHLVTYLGDPSYFTVDGSVYPVGTPYHTEEGVIGYDLDAAKSLLQEAGYKGEPIYVLQATNIATNRIFATVTADQLRRAGLNVQMVAGDFGTIYARALKNDPIDGGNGWHLIHFANIGPDMADPITSRTLSGAGDSLGWSKDDEIVKFDAAYLAEADFDKRKVIAADVQARALDLGFYRPGGTFQQPNAFSTAVSGVVNSPVPIYWNLTKAA